MHKSRWNQNIFEKNLKDNFHANSLDSLANSSNQSESLSDDSHDSDSGTETKSKNSFAVKCEVYAQSGCGSIRSWTKSDCNSESSYDYLGNEKRDCDKRPDNRMETILEENEPKISVKAILARFENLNDKKDKDPNNNSNNITNINNTITICPIPAKPKENYSTSPAPASTILSNSSCKSTSAISSSSVDMKKASIIPIKKEESEVNFPLFFVKFYLLIY